MLFSSWQWWYMSLWIFFSFFFHQKYCSFQNISFWFAILLKEWIAIKGQDVCWLYFPKNGWLYHYISSKWDLQQAYMLSAYPLCLSACNFSSICLTTMIICVLEMFSQFVCCLNISSFTTFVSKNRMSITVARKEAHLETAQWIHAMLIFQI